MNGHLLLLVIFLYAATALSFMLPNVIDSLSVLWRDRSAAATLFVVMALAAAFYAFPTSADKGGPTNPPDPAVSAPVGIINLYFEDASGRLWPIGGDIRRNAP